MKIHNRILRKNEKGATAVYAAVILVLLLGFAALGVDVNYLYGVRNELHNAADAGSLAGASMLFNDNGALTPGAARDEAERVATANTTGNEAVEIETVEIGHWSFLQTNKDLKFTPNLDENPTQLDGWQEMSFSVLDGNPAFINAVKVVTHRVDTPSFFAKIFSIFGSNFNQFFVRADAVAYIGFPSKVYSAELDQPIALCKAAITDSEGNYSCSVTRMFSDIEDTAAWTNLSTDDCSHSGTNNPEASALICGKGNPNEVVLGKDMGLINGHLANSYEDFYDCWVDATNKIKNWNMTLPVVECTRDGMRIENCLPFVGAVNVNVIWVNLQITGNAKNQEEKYYKNVPREMTIYDNDGAITDSWTCPVGYRSCWKSFVEHFGIRDVYKSPPEDPEDYNDYLDNLYQSDHIYLDPDCSDHTPTGGTGGPNFGIMAKIPKLVE